MARAPGLRYGGYEYHFVEEAPEYRFVEAVPEKFICSICTKVQRDPHLTSCCGKHFCESCLKKWLKENKSCPCCKSNKFNHFVNKAQKGEIEKLKIHCIHQEEGCQWDVELSKLEIHLGEECGYVEVGCPNMHTSWHEVKCPLIKRKHLDSHIKRDCPHRMHKCEHCGYKNTYYVIVYTHYKICLEYPLICPNEWCGEEPIKRKDMSAHRDKCPEEPVECPFKEAGCETKLVRRDLDDHMKTQTQQHLLLTFQTMQLLKQICTNLEQELRKQK